MKKHAAQIKAMKKRKKWHKIRIVLAVLFGLLFCISAFFLIKELLETRKEKNAFESLEALISEGAVAETTNAPGESSSGEPSSQGGESGDPLAPETEPTMIPKYVAAYEQNQDFFGWITIDDTNINYPIMYTPDDPQFYLRRAFDGSSSHSGVPFMDADCLPDGNCFLVYGHHMKNGTMFGHLTDYAEQDFLETHQIIRLDTLYEEREYQVIAVFYCDVGSEENGNFPYYEYTDLTDATRYEEFIEKVRQATIYDPNFEVETGTDILMLSTCSYHASNGRFVVVAKRIK